MGACSGNDWDRSYDLINNTNKVGHVPAFCLRGGQASDLTVVLSFTGKTACPDSRRLRSSRRLDERTTRALLPPEFRGSSLSHEDTG